MIKQKIKKLALNYLLAIITVALSMSLGHAQSPESGPQDSSEQLMLVRTHDGVEFFGVVLSKDAREVLILTEAAEEIIIPRHEVESIEVLARGKMVDGQFIGEDRFATRYFYSTNGLPMKKGEHYAMFNYYGPEVHFALNDHVSVGLMTTWLAAPIVASAKISIPVAENFHLGVGGLAGSMIWAGPENVGALGFASATIGDRQNNFTVSGGYAAIGSFSDADNSAPMMSVASMIKVSRRTTLVFDSFIFLEKGDQFGLLIPGIRVSDRRQRGAFQFGMGMLLNDDFYTNIIPIPMASYMINIR
ncbi:MAG: hypothetical protein AB8H47_06105 [Bacteroidia bacterium]